MLGKKEKILSMLKEGKSAKEIASLLETTLQDVYNTKYLAKKKSKGSTKKTVNKPKKKATKKSIDTYRWISADKVDPQTIIQNLQHEIVGYKAVISYLEYRLGLSSTQ